jgi:hypothetical protein
MLDQRIVACLDRQNILVFHLAYSCVTDYAIQQSCGLGAGRSNLADQSDPLQNPRIGINTSTQFRGDRRRTRDAISKPYRLNAGLPALAIAQEGRDVKIFGVKLARCKVR